MSERLERLGEEGHKLKQAYLEADAHEKSDPSGQMHRDVDDLLYDLRQNTVQRLEAAAEDYPLTVFKLDHPLMKHWTDGERQSHNEAVVQKVFADTDEKAPKADTKSKRKTSTYFGAIIYVAAAAALTLAAKKACSSELFQPVCSQAGTHISASHATITNCAEQTNPVRIIGKAPNGYIFKATINSL